MEYLNPFVSRNAQIQEAMLAAVLRDDATTIEMLYLSHEITAAIQSPSGLTMLEVAKERGKHEAARVLSKWERVSRLLDNLRRTLLVHVGASEDGAGEPEAVRCYSL